MIRTLCNWTNAARAFCLVTLMLCTGAMAALGAEPNFPVLTGRVVDDAALMTPSERARLDGWLAEFERATKRQVVVVTIPDLQGYPIEDFGYRLGRAWGIGEKDRNTGALLIVAPKERAVRIEVGYGLEGELTDAVSRFIIEENILPAFRAGDYGQGIRDGTAAILKVLGWDGASAGASDRQYGDAQELSPLTIFILILLMIFFRLFGGGGLGGFGGRRGGVWGARSRGGFSGMGGSFGGGGASGRW